MDKVREGRFWETAAAEYLRQAGVQILEQNFRCSQGEIDLIGCHQGCLIFFEVKYRKNERFGRPEEAVGAGKQQRICRCADVYLYRRRIGDGQPVRFDVIAICGDRIAWIQNAFDYSYRRGKWR